MATGEHVDQTLERPLSRRAFTKGAAALGLAASPLASWLAQAPTSAVASTNITLWDGWTGADNTTTLNSVLKTFDQTNAQGITIVPTALDWDTLFSKWVIAAAGGNPPNVTLHHVTEIAEFAKRGITRPIADLVKTVGPDLSSLPHGALQSAQYNGQLYAVPGDLHPLAMYYNADMVQAAGLDPNTPPTTGAELLHWANKLTIRGSNGKVSQYGIYLPTTGATPRWVWWSFLYQNGGSFLTPGGKANVVTPEARDALQFVVDLFAKYKVVTPGSTGNGLDPVALKKAAIWFIGPWEVNLRLQQKLNFRTAPMPLVGKKRATWANSHCLSISKQSSDALYDADMQFIKWFFQNYALPAKVVGVIPLSPIARSSKEFTQDIRYQYYKTFIGELTYAQVEPTIPQYTSIFSFGKPTPLVTNIEAAIAGSKSVEQALTDMQSGVNDQLARPF